MKISEEVMLNVVLLCMAYHKTSPLILVIKLKNMKGITPKVYV